MTIGLLFPSVNIVAAGGNFSDAIQKATHSISGHLDAAPTDVDMRQGAFEFLANKMLQVVFPILIVAGVLTALFGLYSLMMDPAKTKEGMQMILYGVVGIILLFSARYLAGVIFTTMWNSGTFQNQSITVPQLLKVIYEKMFSPFLKLGIYFSLGVLVLVMMSRVFVYVTAQDDSVKKKAMGVFTRSTVGMLLIMGARQIVEAIYGKQELVLQANVQNLSGIGTEMLNPKHIPILFQVMNWALGLISLILLVIILFQAYKMLTNPDDESNFKSLKQTLMYAMMGLLLIGAAYLIANLFIVI